ncbi:MAG: endolytic transglycosylase MltG [Candidatus Paceibacterota bacterium]
MSKNYIFLLFLIILIAAWVVQGIYLPLSDEGRVKQFRVEPGQGVFGISEQLENKKLIRGDLWFNIYYLLTSRKETLKAGNYNLSPAMSIPEIFAKIRKGKTTPNKITVVEGWTVQDIGQSLERKKRYSAEEFYEVVGYPITQKSEGMFELTSSLEQEYEFLESKPDNMPLEGFLFPDTYYMGEEETSRDLAKKMLGNFEKKYNNLNTSSEKTVFEIVTMASLLEKEVKTLKDKKIVSGILWKRLRNDIPLQVDATVSYITGKNTTNVSINETKIDSPFNTYKYKGLPKGPICNPGLESIEAALNPITTDYWYYLSSPSGDCSECSEGGTYFSKTLRQHKIGKDKYLGN